MESPDNDETLCPDGIHTSALYMDFNLDSFLADASLESNFSSKLIDDFEAVNPWPSHLPISGHHFTELDNHPKIDLTQTKVRFSSTPHFSYDTSPFENSLLSFDNASACFSWSSSVAPGFLADTDSFKVDNASETCGTDVAAVEKASTPAADRRRRPNLRFPRASVTKLESWLAQHSACPYPTDREKNDLKKDTGLKRSQISSWFANARKRGKVRPPPPEIDCVPEQPVLNLPGIENIHPFDRWRLAPLEFEAAEPVDIARAVSREARSCDPVEHYSRTKSRRSKSISVLSNYLGQSTASELSMDIGSRPGLQSAADAQSQTSLPFSEALVRRRRRRQAAASSSRSVTAGLPAKRFQCTFCSDSFQRKHDWQRHEKSQHLPLESWTCSPYGPTHVNPTSNEVTCVFCDAPDPTPAHIQDHGYSACIKRFPAERTFYRKDHLRQHLRLMHGNCAFIDSMKSWNSISSDIRSRCGICGATFETWAARTTHLADHFVAGLTMREWRGDWGFEPHVARILERATLPENLILGAWEETQEGSAPSPVPVSTQTHEGDGGAGSSATNPSTAMTTPGGPNEWTANQPQAPADMFPFVENFSFHDYYPSINQFGLEAQPTNTNPVQPTSLGAPSQAPVYGAFGPGVNNENLQYDSDVVEDNRWLGPWE